MFAQESKLRAIRTMVLCMARRVMVLAPGSWGVGADTECCRKLLDSSYYFTAMVLLGNLIDDTSI